MNALFRYPGSKWSISDWIIAHFPDGYEKLVYLEPFAGSLAVFFKKRPGSVETINDLDSDVVNLFRVLRDNPEGLKCAISLTPYSREEYDKAFEPCEDPVEKARRFIVRTTQAIGPRMSNKSGWRNHTQMKIGGTACKWNSIVNNIDMAAARLRGDSTHLVQIEHMDALRLIRRYNGPDVIMYIDPPYLLSTRNSRRLYKHEMDDLQQKELLETLLESKAKIVLSGYDCDLYNRMLKDWRKDQTLSQTTSTKKAVEVIWMNYDPFGQTSMEGFQ